MLSMETALVTLLCLYVGIGIVLTVLDVIISFLEGTEGSYYCTLCDLIAGLGAFVFCVITWPLGVGRTVRRVKEFKL